MKCRGEGGVDWWLCASCYSFSVIFQTFSVELWSVSTGHSEEYKEPSRDTLKRVLQHSTLVNPFLAWVWHELVVIASNITVTSRNTGCFLLAFRPVGSGCQGFSTMLLLLPSITNLDRVYNVLCFRQMLASQTWYLHSWRPIPSYA